MREIVFFRTGSGRCPVEDFLEGLSSKQAQRVTWVLQLIEDLDRVPIQYWKKLEGRGDIWEVRIQSGGDVFRLLGFLDTSTRFVLTNAFRKKTQKTPTYEIKLAEQRKREFLARRNRP